MRILAVSNGLWNALATTFTIVAGVAGSVLIVRGLDPVDYGLFGYYVWLGGMAGLLGTLAVPVAITKVTSELRGNRRDSQAIALSSSLLFALIIANLALGLFILFVALIVEAPHQIILIVIAGMLVPHAMAAVLRSTLWGRERYRPASIVTIGAAFAQICLVGAAYLLELSTPGYVAAIFSAHVVQAIGLSALIWWTRSDRRAIKRGLILDASVRRHFVAFLVPASLLLILDIPRQRLGVLFLEMFRDLQEVGYFSLAYTIFASLLTMGVAVISAYNPALSRDYGAGDWDQIRIKVDQGLLFATVVVVPMTFGGWATMDPIMMLLYGEKMVTAIPVTHVLLAGLLPSVVIAMFTFTMTAVGGIWTLIRTGLLLSPIAVVLLLVLVPPFGALGAAWAVTIAQVAYAGTLAAIVWRRFGIPLPYRAVLRIVAIGALTTFTLPLVLRTVFPGVYGLVAACVAAAGTYVALLWLFGQLRPLLDHPTGQTGAAS